MMYIGDEEGFRSGGGVFSNIFRAHGENLGAGINLGVNKVGRAARGVWAGWVGGRGTRARPAMCNRCPNPVGGSSGGNDTSAGSPR